MLGCIGKYIDACLYLQTYGYWEKSIWLAKLTLTEKDYIYIVDKWANHLERTSNSSLMMASMVYLHIGSFYKACQALIKAQRGDMAYLLYKGLKEFGINIFESQDDEHLQFEELCISYVNLLLQSGNKKAATTYFNYATSKTPKDNNPIKS
ncbi:unnamed protein product [Gordionus sp. m RMFG-2023]